MTFDVTWHTLLEECEALPPDATLVTPLSDDRVRITNVREHRIVVTTGDSETRPLQRDQFETLYRRIQEADGTFDLGRIPPTAEPYAAVLGLHPRFEVDGRAGTVTEHDTPPSQDGAESTGTDRDEPDLSVYTDALLLIDALERHDIDALDDLETGKLVNLYTLLSEVQRGADDLRQQVADVLLDRLHHDRPVAGEFGSVQRTSRRRCTLRDDDEVLDTLEAEGIDPERVKSVDPDRVEDALEVTTLSETDVFEVEESEYVRKAEVDEDTKKTRLQGLKDRLAASDGPGAEQLRAEIEDLERRIADLTEFESGRAFRSDP